MNLTLKILKGTFQMVEVMWKNHKIFPDKTIFATLQEFLKATYNNIKIK